MIRLNSLLAIFLCILFSSAASGDEKIYLYQMGPTNAPLWPGFTRVAAAMLYTPELGFGLSSTGKIFDVLNVQPDDLCRGFVEVKGKEPLEFKADVPNGEYEVCVMTGDDLSIQSAPRYYLWQQIRITAEGKEVFRKQRDVFALQDADYVPGQSIWDKYIKDRYLVIQFGVKVEDGQLNLSFEGVIDPKVYAAGLFPLNCVMIYPAAAKKRMESDLSEINAKRRQVFEKQWTRIPPNEDIPSFQANAGDVERGYLAWPKNYLEMVFPETVPQAWERSDVIETYASKGEWESVSLCVRALCPMTNVAVGVSDLKCGDSVIAATNVRVYVVRYIELAAEKRREKQYIGGPYTLMDWKKVDVPAELTKQWWLKIHVPESVADGIYEGTVTVAPENAVKLALRLRLRVLPFSLIRSPYANFFYFATRANMYLEMQGRNDYSDKEFRAMFGKEVDFLRERSFWPKPDCSPVRIDVDKTARVVKKINFERVDKQMELLKEFNALPPDRFLVNHAEAIGMRLDIMKWIQIEFPERVMHVEFSEKKEDLDMFIDVCRQVDAYIRGKGYGVPVFEVGGELNNYQKNDEGLKFGMTAYGALRRAGVLTGLRSNGRFDLEVMKAGLVDYAIPNLAVVRDEQTKMMKEKCKELWLYNFSNGRYGYGFFAWKKGATRRPHEMGVICTYGMPWDPFNACAISTGYIGAEPTRDGLASRIYFERMAEGCDDYDYLYTCEQLIKRAEQSGLSGAKSAAVEARRTLDFIAKNTFSDYNFMGDAMAGSGIRRDAGCRWSPGDFQKYRWLVAREIIKLQKALGEAK